MASAKEGDDFTLMSPLVAPRGKAKPQRQPPSPPKRATGPGAAPSSEPPPPTSPSSQPHTSSPATGSSTKNLTLAQRQARAVPAHLMDDKSWQSAMAQLDATLLKYEEKVSRPGVVHQHQVSLEVKRSGGTARGISYVVQPYKEKAR